MSELKEIDVSHSEAIDIARESPDFLAGLAMPTIAEYAWPPVFLALWFWLREKVSLVRAFPLLALGLPRGFGKTTVIKLFILYCILYTNKKFILVLAETAGKAENIIADIKDMLEEPNIRALFGDWKLGIEKDTNAVKKFSFRGRTIILAGLGAGGSVRGLNLKNERPDVILFEDVQSREDADSQEVSEKLYKWMLGTAMKAKSPKGCLTLFIGNMYPTPHSILKKLKANPNWTKFIAGGILEDGTSLWEELQPIKQLMAEYKNDFDSGHPEIFAAEVLNDENAAANNLLDFSKLPAYPYVDDEIHQGSFIVIDPSNDKSNSDMVSIVYFEVQDGKPVAREVVDDRLSPGDIIRVAVEISLRRNCPLVVIEANAFQYSLLYWSKTYCTQNGIEGIQFVPIYSGQRAKNARILEMLKAYNNGEILVHPSVRAQVHAQILAFNPLITKNIDNILDCLTYAPRVLVEYADQIKVSTIEGMQEYSALSHEQFTEAQNSPI